MAAARSPAEVAYWLTRGAEAGIGSLQFRLGFSFYVGRGPFRRDRNKARYWLQEAVKSRYSNAEYVLASHYAGTGGLYPQDLAKARSLLSRAARKLPKAMLQLSIYHRLGLAGPVDKKKAESLMTTGLANALADRRKYKKPTLPPAQIPYRLARHFLCPYAAPVDLTTGRRMLEQAAKHGSASAKRALNQSLSDPAIRDRLCRDWPSLSDK